MSAGRFVLTRCQENDHGHHPEKDLQTDIEAIRADIAALTDTVGKLASEA